MVASFGFIHLECGPSATRREPPGEPDRAGPLTRITPAPVPSDWRNRETMTERQQPGDTSAETTSGGQEQETTPQSGQTAQRDRPRVTFDDAQQAEVNRIAAREAAAAVKKAQTDWQAENERKTAEANGEFEKLLRQSETTVSDLTVKLRLAEARSDVVNAAITAGALEPDGVWKLVKEDLQFDATTGKATNLAEVLADAKQKYPRTFGSAKPAVPGGDGGERGTPSGVANMNDILRGALRPGSAQAQQ
jgi:hypothetical protein